MLSNALLFRSGCVLILVLVSPFAIAESKKDDLALQGKSAAEATLYRIDQTWEVHNLANEQLKISPEVLNDSEFQNFVRVASRLGALRGHDLENPEFQPEALYTGMRDLIARAAPLVARNQALVDGIRRGKLSVTGRELNVSAAAGFIAGGCLGVGVGCRQENLTSRPYLRIWLGTGMNLQRDEFGIGGTVQVGQAKFRESEDSKSTAGFFGPELNTRQNMRSAAVVLGSFRQESYNDDYSSKGIAAGLGFFEFPQMYDFGISIPLPVPGLNWVGVIKENYLLWKMAIAERRIIQALQSFELADADQLITSYEMDLRELEARLSSLWISRPDFTQATLSKTHPLASINRLFSSTALKKYKRAPLREVFSNCATLLTRVILR